MSEMLPGSPIGTVLPGVTVSVPQIEADLADVESVVESVYSNLGDSIVAGYMSVANDLAAIEANVIGGITNEVEAVELVLANLTRKIISGITAKLSDVYAKIIDLGFNIPTLDDVRYGNATGDFIGSMTGQTPKDEPITHFGYVGSTPDLGGIKPDTNTPYDGLPVVGPIGNPSGIPPSPTVPPHVPPVVPNPTPNNPDGCPTWPVGGIVSTYAATGGPQTLAGGTYISPWRTSVQPEPNGGYITYRIRTINDEGGIIYENVILPIGYGLYYNPVSNTVVGATFAPSGYMNCPCVAQAGAYTVGNQGSGAFPPLGDPPPPPPIGGTCPVPNYSCPADYGWNIHPIGHYGDPFCERIKSPDIDWAKFQQQLSSIIGMSGPSLPAQGIALTVVNAITGGNGAIVPEVINRFSKWLTKVIKDVTQSPGCDGAKFTPVATAVGIMNFFQQWTGIIPPQSIKPLIQLMNSVCQYQIPSPAEADNAFLAKTINEETWQCYHKAAGNFVGEFESVFKAKRTKADALQASQLFRREQLTKDEYEVRMRANGVLQSEDVKDLYNLTQSWPGISDVIRFLVRDIADKDLVDKFGMYDDFEKKYAGRLIKYADAVGVSKDLMKDQWAAHWHIPSFTMLTEMLHRLRPGVVAEDLQVTQDDVFEALKQDDWLPYWAKRMIEVSYRNVTKEDSVKAYMIHAIDDEELTGHYLDVGYNEKAANFYVQFQKKRRDIADNKASGLPTIRRLTSQYAKCEITEQEFRDSITKLALSEDHEAKMLEAGRQAVRVEDRKLSVNQVKRPFELGLTDYDEATNQLSNTDIDPRCVRALVDAWALKQLKRSKFLSVGQLCKMRERGIIGYADHVRALVRNNWDRQDAERIATECGITVSEKQAARARREADRAQRIREKLAREEAKRRKLEACGPPSCPTNTPGGMIDPPITVPDSSNL